MKRESIRYLAAATVMAISLAVAGTAQAANLYFDSGSGWSGDWGWYDGGAPLTLGPMDYISTGGSLVAYTGWSTYLAAPGYISIQTQDDYVPGDEFKLVLDGSEVEWPSAYYSTSTDAAPGFESNATFFHGDYLNLYLGAGSHTFSFNVTKLTTLPLTLQLGEAEVAFSAVRPVPAPASVLLFGAGMLGLVWFQRKSFRRG